VSRNVLLLGLTSLFTDISSEMLTAVLPLYFMLELRASPLQFGIVDGLYQAGSVLARVASGIWADSRRRYKELAVTGYALSAVCKAGLLVVGGAWRPVTVLLMIDRLGKGIRTAPRDALIALSSDRARLGEAFGVHRTLDTIGGAIGPLLAFVVLALVPGSYDSVFVVSLAFGLVGVAVISLFVKNHRADVEDTTTHRETMSRSGLTGALATPRLRSMLIAGAVLGVLTASDAMIYLVLQRQGAVSITLFPLLFVGTSMVYLIMALPVGRLADRVGRHRLFVAGHVPVVAIYAILLARPTLSLPGILACITLLGFYYAATDGVLAALTSGVLESSMVTTGLALTGTVWVVSRACAAILFGALWSALGPSGALAVFCGGLIVAIGLASRLLQVSRIWQTDPGGL
jgi:MFS family permease